MPEKDDKDAKNFHLDIPTPNEPFFLRGSNALDWGLKNRLAKIFNPQSGRTVMLAIDHGYFQGPTTGLERVDVNIVPLLPYSDTLMCTRGILRSTIPPTYGKGVVMRMSGGPSILKELSNERLAVDIEDAVRLNVAAMAVQVFIGGEFETQSVHNMTRLVDAGLKHGIATLAVTAVGRDMVRAWRAGSAPNSAPPTSRPTTATTSRPSPRRVRSRSSSPAARSSKSGRPSSWPRTRFRPERSASTWDATSSSPTHPWR
jgi:putative autoinducer-2 (AI-2) aldolase